jgi:uncharacterized protein YjiK
LKIPSRFLNYLQRLLRPMKTKYLLIALLITGCASKKNSALPFDFDHPTDVIKLPQKLHEISGICFYRKKELACVQDEKGVVYFYDIKKDKLRSTTSFSRNRDYEGITDVNDTIYVLCSNGDISEIDSAESVTSISYSTFLNKENNSEGLCYDPANYRLLIACKGKPKKGTASKGMKAIYSFDLSQKKLSETPVFVIDPDSVKAHLIEFADPGIFSFLSSENADKKDFAFDPSEIGIDPLTSDIYILSSVGKTILCLDPRGAIKFAFHLNPHLFKQPEGLTFSKDGTMYISDEGREGKANLVKLVRTNEAQ